MASSFIPHYDLSPCRNIDNAELSPIVIYIIYAPSRTVLSTTARVFVARCHQNNTLVDLFNPRSGRPDINLSPDDRLLTSSSRLFL
jgi:hypothetical protein